MQMTNDQAPMTNINSTNPAHDDPMATVDDSPVRKVLTILGSLRLTVVLLSLSAFLVLAGTLAQIDHDIWYVVWHMFRTWVAWIELQFFFPRTTSVPGLIPYPGGWLIGTCLAVNLLAAEALRFKMEGHGRKLLAGWVLIAVGALATYAVILSGLDETVESELSPRFAAHLWQALLIALGLGTLALCYWVLFTWEASRQWATRWLWWSGAVAGLLLVVLTVWLLANPEARLNVSGLRILWQLIKGGAAGLVLLVGCRLVFGRRGGIVLLHTGVLLLMFSELHTGLTAKEARMTIAEGQTVNFAEDRRTLELAVTDHSPQDKDRVTVVPIWKVQEAAQRAADAPGRIIDDPQLPVALRLVEYYPNSFTRLAQPGEPNLATEGNGRRHKALPRPTVSITDKSIDIPAAYVELLAKPSHESLGTFLLSPELPLHDLPADSLEAGEKRLSVEMRFKRIPKDYSITLTDFRFDRYVGTNTPKNFSSEVILRDPENQIERTATIWMNNPLRYAGDTLYQTGYDPETEQSTVLQVVSNTGWMIPYVACMLVSIGMFSHFWAMLLRFARQRADETLDRAADSGTDGSASWRKSPAVWFPTLVVAVFALWVLGRARPPVVPGAEMQIHQFGSLPLAYEARVKPYDTLARNALRIVSGKQTYQDEQGKRQPAVRWLLDVIADTPASREHRVIRIDNLEVLETLDLERRSGFRYSLDELFASHEAYIRQVELAERADKGKRTLMQKRFLELSNKISLIQLLHKSFQAPQIRTDSKENAQQDLWQYIQLIQGLNTLAPRAVPPENPGGEWKTLLEADLLRGLTSQLDKPTNEATSLLRAILDAYADDDTEQFNAKVAEYAALVQTRADADRRYDAQLAAEGQVGWRKTAEKLSTSRVRFEAFFNHFNPFLLAMVLYLVAFVLSAASWLGWSRPLGRASTWLLWMTLVLHTFALAARIYISGRPPVTNLYSSAVFIGWAAVLFALVYEQISRIGVGNLLAAAIGFPTLLVAYQLAGDGDTFRVLQAVLDTQFWLATHVVCITLGYSTTLLAGLLGIVQIVGIGLLDRFKPEQREQLVRMTYGTICFALFFSFVGTVLGGLWADDSWGRFWGWDPKENGALIIVIWNALILHARWGRLIGPRGLAVLAVAGNIVTTWSWFGVNELGVGLHSYGFSEGTTFWLAMFVLSQLAVITAGLMIRGKGNTVRGEVLDS